MSSDEESQGFVDVGYLDIKDDRDDPASVQHSVDDTERTNESTDYLTESTNTDYMAGKLQTDIENLQLQIEQLKLGILRQSKLQTIAWAMDKTHLGSFQYQKSDMAFGSWNSSEVVKDILCWFRKGQGMYLPEGAIVNGTPEGFHECLVNQLHLLLGDKPTIEKKGHRFAIFYM